MLYRFYKLQYANLIYIGKTFRTLEERFNEHKSDSINDNRKCNYFVLN